MYSPFIFMSRPVWTGQGFEDVLRRVVELFGRYDNPLPYTSVRLDVFRLVLIMDGH